MFFKKNSKIIIKLIIYQFAMTAMSLMLLSAAVTINVDWLLLLMSVFAIIVYLYLVYTAAWELGSREEVSIAAGHMKDSPAKGFLIGLCAGIPNILFAAVTVIGAVINVFNPVGDTIYTVAKAAALLWHGMYIGVFSEMSYYNPDGWLAVFESLKFLAAVLPAIGVTGIAYILGRKNISFRSSHTHQSKPHDNTR